MKANAPCATLSTWRAALDAFASAESVTVEELLTKGRPLIRKIPADSTIWLLEISEKAFKGLVTIHGEPRRTLDEESRRVLRIPEQELVPEDQRTRRSAQNFSFSCLHRRALLFGHSLEGPFTILEGNHRAVSGYVAVVLLKKITYTPFEAYVAVSPEPCAFHGPDLKTAINRDPRLNFEKIRVKYNEST